jgi:DNA modification methylase
LLRQIGYADALLAREDEGRLVLIDGHLRKSLDPDQIVPVLVLDLNEQEADTLLATLDPLAAMAQADPAPLAELLDRVEASNAAVAELLASVARRAGLPARTGLSDPEEVPSIAQEPRVRPGELWRLGRHRLLCADATDPVQLARLMDGELADVLWTDPPYGVAYRGKTARALRIAGDEPGDLDTLLPAAFGAIDKVLAPGAALYVMHPDGASSVRFGEAFLDAGWRLRQRLIWVKDRMVLGHSDYHFRHEPILYGFKPGGGRRGRGHLGWHGDNRQDSVLEVPRPAASRDHPTSKPVALVARCLANSSGPGDRVLDAFAGSGPVLIASEQLDRRAFAMELDPSYCDVILHRWETFTGETAELEGG